MLRECPGCQYNFPPTDFCHQCGKCLNGCCTQHDHDSEVVKCNECRRAVMVKETCPHGFCPDCECNGCAEAEADEHRDLSRQYEGER